MNSPRALLPLLALLLCFEAGCRRRTPTVDGRFQIGFAQGGVSAKTFQSIADYLEHPAVQLLFANMPRHTGSAPPAVAGTYDAFGEITATSVPGTFVGQLVDARFCFGTRSASRLEVQIIDPSVEDVGALSFIEGAGSAFTVFTAFRSVQTLLSGLTCEIHEINIFSGRREVDGSLSELFIGQAVVGLLGDCGLLLVGDVQISRTAANRTGDGCADPASGPVDQSKVELVVHNLLRADILVFLDYAGVPSPDPAALVGPAETAVLEVEPRFTLVFESLQPIAGADDQGNDILMGEIIAGIFPENPVEPGGITLYQITNIVGRDVFFAPRPLNRSSAEIFSVVNTGVPIPGYPDPPGSGLDCFCAMPPAQFPYDIGYYIYSAPGIIDPVQCNIRFFRLPDEREVARFSGPFEGVMELVEGEPAETGDASGGVIFEVD
jgi:hypothetical protein